MKNTYVSAKLIEPKLIRVVIFSSLPWEKFSPILEIDDTSFIKLGNGKISSLPSLCMVDFVLEKELELGHSYFVTSPQYGRVPLDVSEATSFIDFEKKYYYGGDDLGATYSKNETSFALFAPLASKVYLALKDKKEEFFKLYPMDRFSCGVYKIKIEGDHEGALYYYVVRNNEVDTEVTDPYAKGSTANGKYSAVIDFSKVSSIKDNLECLPVLSSPTESIIYEANVRDMTISSYTNIVNKGKFLGLIEENRTSLGGMKAGFDYIKSLGITHIQLLPVFDFKSVDELHPEKGYNWGYDPAQYFALEGSYSTNPEDPYSRIVEFKKMVSSFHKAGIRVVMDVVFNHVYQYEKSVFEKVIPSFYFRKRHNGQLASTSGCGNDLASEKRMVSKLIIDCLTFFVSTYGLDGFRFDLMGINDVNTINEAYCKCKKIKPDIIFYGEGWNMGGEVNVPLANMSNYALMPNVGFFNDFFRESVKKYCSGDLYNLGNAMNSYIGSCIDFHAKAKFLNANQSINYVECHDNMTLFDALGKLNHNLSEEDKCKIINLTNAFTMLSFGIPFFHAGQEIGQSKFNHENTYNEGDYYNKFSYSLLEKRKSMYNYFVELIKFRKSSRFLTLFDPRVIDSSTYVGEYFGSIKVSFILSSLVYPHKEIGFYFNPTPVDINLPSSVYEVNLLETSKTKETRIIPKRSCLIYYI